MQLSKFSNSNSNLNDSNSIPGGPYFNPEFWVRTLRPTVKNARSCHFSAGGLQFENFLVIWKR